MKKALLQQIIMGARYTFYVFLIQVATMSLLFASHGNAQDANNVKKVKLDLKLNQDDIFKVIKKIENATKFTFTYNEADLQQSHQITGNYQERSLYDILVDVSRQTGLQFKQIDQNINVFKKISNQSPPIEIAEPVIITGKVTEAETGEGLPGVNIIEKGTNNGTVTDVEGNYSLTVQGAEAILIFSSIGFLTQEMEVGDRTTVDLALSTDVQSLSEVVVVGYSSMKKVNLTGAVSTVDVESLDNRPLTNSTQALQGTQGVYVNQSGGQPGRDQATIRIRGQGTLNNNNPLVLVDGIEFDLNDVDPANIESISVLKDAASAAIYGSRAANGVILVTTKSGRKGGFTTEYRNSFGIQSATYLPDVVKDPVLFMEKRNEAQLNEGRQVTDYTPEMIEEYRQGMLTDPYTYPNNDWYDIMFNDSFIQQHNARFSGGSEDFTFSLGLGFMDQDGVLMGTDSKKYSLGLNTSAQLTKNLKVGANITGTYRDFNEPAAGVYNLMEMTLKAQAFHPTYLEDGRYADTWIRTPGHNVYRHPLALANEGENNHKVKHYLLNVFADYKLPLDIMYKINVGLNVYDEFAFRFVPDVYEYQNKTLEERRIDFNYGWPRHVRNAEDINNRLTVFQTLRWQKTFNANHNFSVLLGTSFEKVNARNFYAYREGYLGNTLQELDAGSTNPDVGGSSFQSGLLSYFGRVNYDFREKYLVEANFRYDGSSRFGNGYKWGVFPSFSAGWRMNNEAFLQDVSWLSNLKLRASWGQLGNERIEDFRYIDLIELGQDYIFGNNISSGAAVTTYNDPKITWETTRIANLGIDAGFFDNKLNFTFEAFNKRTSDILREVNLPAQVGNLDGPIQNIGVVDNNGFELGLSIYDQINEFSYEVSGSVTKINNEVVDLRGQTIYDGNFITEEGYPIDSYYLIQADGIFQSDDEVANSPFQTANTKAGYLKYVDENQDDIISTDDRVIVGRTIPEYTYSMNIKLRYKGFDLTAFLQGVQNIDTYAERIAAMPFWFGTAVTKDWITDSWTPENPNASLPILTTFEGSQNENFRPSTFWLQDASYLRLKNLQIGYTIPAALAEKLKLKHLKVFVNGENLLTFSKMKDFDPEKNIKGSNYYEYPSIKIMSAGLNVSF